MKRIFYIFLALFFINNANALTNLTNDNTTDTISYISYSVDNIYQLDISDNFIEMKNNYEIITYPLIKTETFYDNLGNKIDIIITYHKISGYLYDDINTVSKIKYNNILFPFDDGSYYYYKNETSIDVLISGLYDSVDIDGKIITIHPINGFRGAYITLPTINYFNNFTLVNNSSTLTYSGIAFKYRDNGISFLQSTIDESYSGLSFPFKFIFIIFKGVIKIVQIITLGYLIDELDVLEFQNYFIVPLSYLDYVITFLFDVLHFITTMGILWFLTVSTCIIFIYSYLKSDGDIIKTFGIFLNNEKAFFTILINALRWIYEHVMLGILKIVRG